MTFPLSVWIEGRPVPQPRHHGKGRTAYVPKEHAVHGWRQAVAMTVLDAWNRQRCRPIAGPVALRLIFLMPRPGSHERPQPPELHTIKPDLDNLEKAAKDALRLCWGDDCQVAAVWKEKRWAPHGHPGGLALELHAIPDDVSQIPRIRLSRET